MAFSTRRTEYPSVSPGLRFCSVARSDFFSPGAHCIILLNSVSVHAATSQTTGQRGQPRSEDRSDFLKRGVRATTLRRSENSRSPRIVALSHPFLFWVGRVRDPTKIDY